MTLLQYLKYGFNILMVKYGEERPNATKTELKLTSEIF